jgi:hypothetical protein
MVVETLPPFQHCRYNTTSKYCVVILLRLAGECLYLLSNMTTLLPSYASHFPSLQNIISSCIDANLGHSRRPLITCYNLPSYILQSVLSPALYLILASTQRDILLLYNIFKNTFVLYRLYKSSQ